MRFERKPSMVPLRRARVSGSGSAGIFLLLSVFFLGCSERKEGTEIVAFDTTESGIRWVRNIGEGSWAEDEHWDPSVSLVLGKVDGDGPDVFGNAWSLAIDPGGMIYVLDDLAQEIRVFDRDGVHQFSFGRRGQGPGEFDYADGITLDPDGNLWVVDPRRQRMHVFQPDGSFLREAHRRSVGSASPWPGVVLPDGTIVDLQFSRPERDFNARIQRLGSLDLYEPVRVHPEDGTVESFPGVGLLYPMVGQTRVPGAVRVALALDRNGSLWFSHHRDYTLYHRSLSGDTLLVVSLEGVEPERVTEAEIDSLVREFRGRPASVPGSTADIPSPSDFPTHRPVIQRILTDGAGHLLVFPRLAELPVGRIMDVFEIETGDYLGRVELPVPVERRVAARAIPGHLYVVVRVEYDVNQVIRIDFRPGL